jgi:calcineurin-like phosphoesterase family protein
MQKTFFISDLHFGHKRMLEYENRPFETVEKMDEALISNWNKKVKNQYYIYVLGDFSFHSKEKTKEILNRLNGRKILILGNHDRRKSLTYWRSVGFEEVSKYPILFEDLYLLSHEPRYELADHNLYYNIHGHIHSKDISCNPERYYNVSVEKNNYTPVDFEVIKNHFLKIK